MLLLWPPVAIATGLGAACVPWGPHAARICTGAVLHPALRYAIGTLKSCRCRSWKTFEAASLSNMESGHSDS